MQGESRYFRLSVVNVNGPLSYQMLQTEQAFLNKMEHEEKCEKD
jgi:hypothetical protein